MADEIISHSFMISKSSGGILTPSKSARDVLNMTVMTRPEPLSKPARSLPEQKNEKGFLKGLRSAAGGLAGKIKDAFSGVFRTCAAAWRYAKVFPAFLKRKLDILDSVLRQKIAVYTVPRAAGVAVLSAAVILTFSTAFVGVGLQVYIDGEPIGFVSNQDDFRQIVSDVEDRASNILGYPYLLDIDVEYNFEVYTRQGMLDGQGLEDYLFSQIDEIDRLYVLSVDGEVVGANEDRAAIEAVLDDILVEDNAPADARFTFLRDVDVEYQYTSAANLTPIADITDSLMSNAREETLYVVKAGDIFTEIAAAHGVSLEALKAMNSEVDADVIIEGDMLVVQKALPLMSVQKVQTEVYDVVIEYETEYINDNTMYAGTREVDVAGANGLKTVTASVTYVDGSESARDILSELVETEPTTEVVRVGTKKRLATGSFIVPSRGKISSRFGGRIFRGSYDFHSGIDFATSKGSSIVASDGGTVTFSGYKGNYGYLVIIDHGNGYSTYYAHCSKLLVSVGQKVAQGELIARVGSTGRSTGSHCHFEIRVNGTAVNPASYLWK